MLSASFTSLILPGIEAGGLLPVVIGLALGVFVLDRADAWVPHVHVLVTGRRREDAAAGGSGRIASVILFIVAITLHNMPEGLAVGVGFGGGDLSNAISLMLAIGIQNIPEGFAVSVAARNAGLGNLSYAAITGIRAGAVEIPIALFGAWAVGLAAPLLPLRDGLRSGWDALRHQRRDHPRDAYERQRAHRHLGHDGGARTDARAGRGARVNGFYARIALVSIGLLPMCPLDLFVGGKI